MKKYSRIISLIIIVALTFASVNVFDITKVEAKKSVVKSLKVKGAKKTLSLNIGNKKTYLRKANLFEAFTALDTNNNGKITKNELMEILKVQPKQDKYITKLISLADKNGDGDIDYKEFIEMMGYTD